MRLLINPGHAPRGVPDPGAIGTDGTPEWAVAAAIGEAAAQALRTVAVCGMLQSDSLDEIVRTATEFGADRFLSIHANAAADSRAHGAEIYVHPDAGEEARDWANRIARAAVAAGIVWRGGLPPPRPDARYKEADYYVLRRTPMPAVLLEAGFLTHPGDCRWLRTNAATVWAQVLRSAWK